MTPQDWQNVLNQVTEQMRVYTRQFVTPLGTHTDLNVRLVGTGNYVAGKTRILLTCEHVVREQPMTHRFQGSDNVFDYKGTWVSNKHPIDAAYAHIETSAWGACPHKAAAIPRSRFAESHSVVDPAEPLFFLGYSGENACFAFETHNTNGTGYCAQEKTGSGDEQAFELFWQPELTQFTTGTSQPTRSAIKLNDPRGFSGSLVWNTRYLEVSRQGREWSPEDAVVTGMVRRWNTGDTTLSVWRIEHLSIWLEERGFI